MKIFALLSPVTLSVVTASSSTDRITSTASASLFDSLSSVTFFGSGTAHATDQYEDVNMAVSYNEPDNVTCAMCGWSVGNGKWTYPWQTASSVKDPAVLEEAKAHGYADTSYVAPPLGIRSAPQIGGVSTGSVELRADGSFREWTILNQG